MPTHDYDMIVIGGGAAGLTASGFSALMGAKTALIEPERLGGECTWTGCIPSKALLKAARVAHQIRTAGRYGLTPSPPEFDFRNVIENVHRIQQRIFEDADAAPNMERLGVEVIQARAEFRDPHTIQLNRARTISSRFLVIAAGSKPAVPPIPGLDRIPYLTNETIFSLTSLPARLLVVGAGPVGIEMAQAFRRLGSEVTVVVRGNRILQRDDQELSAMLLESLVSEGVQFRFGTAFTLDMARDADAVLIATGRKSTTDGLNLEAAGIRYDGTGIQVDRRCRTNLKHVYACGDVTGKLQFTHMAEHTAKVAINNAILHLPSKFDERFVPWCTFTDPELAHVGWGERELRQRGIGYRTYCLPFSKIDRAVVEGEGRGLVKVFGNRSGRIYGASILGTNAGEMIGEFALAARNGLSLNDVASTIHPYPTFGLGDRKAADQWAIEKRTPTLVRWIQRVFGYRGKIVSVTGPL